MVVTARTFEQIATGEPDRQWELHRGELREKPAMTASHNRAIARLGFWLQLQLDLDAFDVRINAGHVHRPIGTYYIPDLFVVPVERVEPLLGRPGTLEVYRDPLPLVVEVWSPSTGGYDVDDKLPEYMARGDREIWRLHPYDETLTAWRRQSDDSYAETVYLGGTVEPIALPAVTIDLDKLFASIRGR